MLRQAATGRPVVHLVDRRGQFDDRVGIGGGQSRQSRQLAHRYQSERNLFGDIAVIGAAGGHLVDVHRGLHHRLVGGVAGQPVHILQLLEQRWRPQPVRGCDPHPLGVDGFDHPARTPGDAVGLGAVGTNCFDA